MMGTREWNRHKVMPIILEKYGAIKGVFFFRTIYERCMRRAEDEIARDEWDDGDYSSLEERADELFCDATGFETEMGRLIGRHSFPRPAAFRIDEDEFIGPRPTGAWYLDIHIFEVARPETMPLWKILGYADMDDYSHDTRFTLHFIDLSGCDVARIDTDHLASLCFVDIDMQLKKDQRAAILERVTWPDGALTGVMQSGRKPDAVNWKSKNLRERAFLDAAYQLGLINPGEDL